MQIVLHRCTLIRRMEILVRTTDMVMIATQNQPQMSDTGPPLLKAMEKEPAQGSLISPFLSAVSHELRCREVNQKGLTL